MKISDRQLNLENRKFFFHKKIKTPVNYLKLLSELNQLFQRLTKVILGSNELQIWETCDDSGNSLWHAYDPVTERYTSVNSEAEIRAWIEQRYYK